MKKIIAITLFTFFTLFIITAQDAAYYQAISKASQEMGIAKDEASLQKVKNTFSRISENDKTAWLPLYNLALINNRMAFMNAGKADFLANETLAFIEKGIGLTDNNNDMSELMVLKGMTYTTQLLVDPMSRGQEYSMLAGRTNGEALALNPNNPRAKLMNIQSKIGRAKFFKEDLKPYIKEAKKLLTDWDDFKPASALHPNWGKDQLEKIVYGKDEPKTKKIVKSNTEKYTIHVKIQLRNSKGVVMVQLKDEKNKIIDNSIVQIKNNVVMLSFEVDKKGKYSVSFIHDENENNKLDMNFIGIPQEGYGFSNNAKGFMGPPDFEETLFKVQNDIELSIKGVY